MALDSVVIFDSTFIVGEKGLYGGSVYIYHRDSGTNKWTLQQKLVPDDEYSVTLTWCQCIAIYDIILTYSRCTSWWWQWNRQRVSLHLHIWVNKRLYQMIEQLMIALEQVLLAGHGSTYKNDDNGFYSGSVSLCLLMISKAPWIIRM